MKIKLIIIRVQHLRESGGGVRFRRIDGKGLKMKVGINETAVMKIGPWINVKLKLLCKNTANYFESKRTTGYTFLCNTIKIYLSGEGRVHLFTTITWQMSYGSRTVCWWWEGPPDVRDESWIKQSGVAPPPQFQVVSGFGRVRTSWLSLTSHTVWCRSSLLASVVSGHPGSVWRVIRSGVAPLFQVVSGHPVWLAGQVFDDQGASLLSSCLGRTSGSVWLAPFVVWTFCKGKKPPRPTTDKQSRPILDSVRHTSTRIRGIKLGCCCQNSGGNRRSRL